MQRARRGAEIVADATGWSWSARIALIDRALDRPRDWAADRERQTAAGVPEDTRFATTIAVAPRMLARTCDADIPAS
jgi:hypothetical protein